MELQDYGLHELAFVCAARNLMNSPDRKLYVISGNGS